MAAVLYNVANRLQIRPRFSKVCGINKKVRSYSKLQLLTQLTESVISEVFGDLFMKTRRYHTAGKLHSREELHPRTMLITLIATEKPQKKAILPFFRRQAAVSSTGSRQCLPVSFADRWIKNYLTKGTREC